MKRRIFVAVNLSWKTKKEIKDIIKKLKSSESGVKWVNSENIHLTLAFLGRITDEEVGKVTAILKLFSKKQKRFKLNLGSIGFFPSSLSPRIIWIGSGGNFNLLKFQSILSRNLKVNGFNIENRSFVPHLTIGRVKGRIKKNRNFVKLTNKINLEDVLVRDIDVMESVLKKGSLLYKVVFKVNLKNISEAGG